MSGTDDHTYLGSQSSPATHWSQAKPGDYAVLGDPVAHSLSPKIHAAAYQAANLPYSYQALQVPLQEFPQALAHLADLGFKGVNCTLPLKEAAAAWAHRREGYAETLQVANTLDIPDRRATNTDVPAFLKTLAEAGIDLATNPKVLLLGAGGTARALIPALHHAGAKLQLWNRTPARLHSLLQELRLDIPILPTADASQADLVVNTTSASLQNQIPPVQWPAQPRTIPPLAYDLAYAPNFTPFLQDARHHHCQTLDGIPMLVEQAALAFEWWTGIPAPRKDMLAAVS